MNAEVSQSTSRRPSWRQIGLYSLPASGLNFMENLIGMFLLKFTTDVLLLAPGLVALFFGVARIWDAVSDPFVGYWSDRTRTRFGRRRPWILASSLPLALAFAALWAPPVWLSGGALEVWVCASVILFFTAQTAFAVPHLAWGAEFGGDAHDKTRVFGGRLAVALLGVFGAAFGMSLLERAEDPRAIAGVLALVGGGAMMLLCVVATSRLGERPEYQGRGGETPYAAFGDVVRNRHARLMIAVFFLEALGFASMTTTMPFFIQYVSQRPGETGLFMGGALGAMLAAIPLWLVLARRFGKKKVWLASLLGRAIAFGIVALLPGTAIVPMVIAVAFIGAFFGCGGMLGPSVKADVIDDDERRTGQRKEGSYFATWKVIAPSSKHWMQSKP